MRRFVGLLVTLAACGHGEGGGPGTGALSAEDADPICREGCERDVMCGNQTDLEMCVADCIMEVAGWARGDAFQTLADCTSALACDANDDVCLEQVQPLPIHEEWEMRCRMDLAACLDPTQIESACEVSPDPTNNDIGLFRFIAPEIMEEVIACLDMADCNARLTCVQGVLDAHNINF